MKKNIKFGNWYILDANGWDLNKEFPKEDYEYLEQNIKIPSNIGLGIIAKRDDDFFTSKFNGKPTVELEITTWRGISAGAMHYYGKLKFDLPQMKYDSKSWVTSCWDIPMFHNHVIELTQVLEEWEKEKYPDAYEYFEVGDNQRGFYSVDAIERRGKEIFEKVFEKGWKLKIDRAY